MDDTTILAGFPLLAKVILVVSLLLFLKWREQVIESFDRFVGDTWSEQRPSIGEFLYFRLGRYFVTGVFLMSVGHKWFEWGIAVTLPVYLFGVALKSAARREAWNALVEGWPAIATERKSRPITGTFGLPI